MNSGLAGFCIFILSAGLGLCQAPGARLQFEVASVKPSPPMGTELRFGRHFDGAQARFVQHSLRDYIRIAYRVKDYQIEAPGWLASARFDVSGKVPEGGAQDEVPEMLQSLLADRFGLKLHRASHNLPIYALLVRSGGPKMTESPRDPDEDSAPQNPVEVKVTELRGRGGVIQYGGGSYFALPRNRVEGRKLAMVSFAHLLGFFTDRPVSDQTGLSARYDFGLDLTAEDYDALMARAAVATGMAESAEDLLRLSTAGDPLPMILRRLGLQLEPRRGPVDVLIVDEISKTPTEN